MLRLSLFQVAQPQRSQAVAVAYMQLQQTRPADLLATGCSQFRDNRGSLAYSSGVQRSKGVRSFQTHRHITCRSSASSQARMSAPAAAKIRKEATALLPAAACTAVALTLLRVLTSAPCCTEQPI
jgi:hypothetical protein